MTLSSVLLCRVSACQNEEDGKGYRVDVTHTYVVNTDFLEQARKVELEGRKLPQQHSNVTVTSLQRRRGLRQSIELSSPSTDDGLGFGRSASHTDLGHRLSAFPSMAMLKGAFLLACLLAYLRTYFMT
jgi:hypothetical protein